MELLLLLLLLLFTMASVCLPAADGDVGGSSDLAVPVAVAMSVIFIDESRGRKGVELQCRPTGLWFGNGRERERKRERGVRRKEKRWRMFAQLCDCSTKMNVRSSSSDPTLHYSVVAIVSVNLAITERPIGPHRNVEARS